MTMGRAEGFLPKNVLEVCAKLHASFPDKEQPALDKAKGNIFRVSEHIRATDLSAYEPQIVAIGPYHRDKPHLKSMDHVKSVDLKNILRRNGGVCLTDCVQLVNGLMA